MNISDSDVIALNKKIDSKQDLKDIFSDYNFDIAICCADTPVVEIDYWFDDLFIDN